MGDDRAYEAMVREAAWRQKLREAGYVVHERPGDADAAETLRPPAPPPQQGELLLGAYLPPRR